MKYTRFIKSSFWIALLACTSNVFTACEDDITISSENNSFGNIEGNFGYVKSAAGAKALTAIAINGDKHGTGHLYFELNKATNKDITVTFKVDESALNTYNQVNGTNYPMYPTDKLSLENEGITTIPAGKRKSSSVELDIQPGGTIGTRYAVTVSATASDGIETSSNNESYIYLVTPQATLPNTEKGRVKTICYIEVNNENILNAGEYTMENSKKPFFDIVNVFAANIRLNEEGKPYVHCNPQVTFVLENADKLIRPLQQKGIKVHLTILGDHTPAGMRSLGDEAAKDFAKELKSYVDIYGFDGISFDDEWSNYEQVGGHPGLVVPSQEQYSRLIYECRQIMPDKQIGVYWCKQENGEPSINYPLGEIEGKDVNDLLDYTVFGNYNLWNELSHIDKTKQCPYAINVTEDNFYPNSVYLSKIKNEWGYFAIYNLKASKVYSSKFNEIGQTLYNDNIIWTEQVYGRTDFTPSRSSAIKDYNYYLGNWKISTAQQYNWTGSKWENKFSKMEFNIRIEENIKNESYYVYGWAPYGKLLEQYPLTMLYTNSDTNPLSIPMPQVLHYSDATDPLMWKMCWATPGRTANSWTVGGKEGEFRAILNSDGSITLKPFPFNDNRNCTAVPYCSNDGGNTWLYTHTIFQEAHPTGLNYELTKQ
jgi:putative endo-beta-N-acetylglucosaminidase F1